MRKVLIVGNYGADNVGDELILQGMLVLCKKLSLAPSVISNKPGKTSRQYDVPAYRRLPFGIRSFLSFSWMLTVGKFLKTDYVFLGGGGLFVDRFFAAPFIWGLHGFLAVLFRKPLFLIGHSFELRKGVSKFILTFLSKRARVVIVRDTSSLKLLSSLKIDTSKCFVFPDMSSLVQLGKKGKDEKKIIGVSLCTWGLSQKKISEVLSFLNHCLEVGYEKIRFFVFQGGHDDDKKVYETLIKKLPHDKVDIISHDDTNFIQKFSCVSFLLGMRLHSILLAFLHRIPFTAIAYQDKVRRSLEDMGLASYCFSVNRFSDKDLHDAMNRASKDTKFFTEASRVDDELKKLPKILSSYL